MPNQINQTPTVKLFGIQIDAVSMDQAVMRLQQWIADCDRRCRYVVTPNVDHTVLFQSNRQLRDAYAGSSLVLADGWPVVLASRLLGKRLPERVTGSDLVPALFSAAKAGDGLRVFLLGAGPGIAERAAERIEQRWPAVSVVGTNSPPIGFEHLDQQNQEIIDLINASRADVLVVGLGAPKQELWVTKHAGDLNVSVALCAGATIDFLAGHESRAPKWMQRTGLEWLHRCCSEPRRLVRRYARDARIFPQIVWREWRQSRNPA